MSIKTQTLGLLATLASLATASPVAARDTPRPALGNVPYGTRITQCPGGGKIALTFDDGPSVYTEGIVNTLEQNGIKGTFFIVGNNGNSGLAQSQFHPLVKRMLANGHHLASHGWEHEAFGNGMTRDQMKANLLQNEATFADVLGVIPTYFRPPYTECNADCYSVLGELGYHVTDYNVDTNDWDVNKDPKVEYLAGLGQPSTNSYIVLSHDIQERTASNGFVQWMIAEGKARGLSFVTLGECLGDSSDNWYRNPTTGASWTAQNPPPPPPPGSTTTATNSPTTTQSISVTTSSSTTITTTSTWTSTRHYGNATVTITGTVTSTYCPSETTASTTSPKPPKPTCGGGEDCPKPPHPTKSGNPPKPTCGGEDCPKPPRPTESGNPPKPTCGGGEDCPKPPPTCDGVNCPKPTTKPYPTADTTVKPNPSGTGVPVQSTSTKPPVVVVNAAPARSANVVAAGVFAAVAWLVL